MLDSAKPTPKVASGAIAGGGVVGVTAGLVALGVTPSAALAGALVASIVTILAAYMKAEVG